MEDVQLAAIPQDAHAQDQFSPHPSDCERDLVCLGESGVETALQDQRNADEHVNADRSENGSKHQKRSSTATNSRRPRPVKTLSQTTRQFHNLGESRLPRKSKGRKAQPSSNLQSTTANLRKESVSRREVAAAAKMTAVMAAKTPAEAKAIAADKAAAAAVANAALEAVALAACDETQKLRRKSSRRHHNTGTSDEQLKSREVELGQQIKFSRISQMPPPVDDEELARQLHRAMNSSPRISRNMTLFHGSKEDGTSLSSSQRHFKYEHPRRRSSSLKDVEKPHIETSRQSLVSSKSHGVELEPMITVNELIPVNNPGSSGNNFSDDITSDFEASRGHLEDIVSCQKSDGEHVAGVTEKTPRRKRIDEPGLLNVPKDYRMTKSTSTSKNESVYSNDRMLSNINSEDWSVKANSMDVEQSVNQSASNVREKKAAGIRRANKARSRDSVLLACNNEKHNIQSEEKDSQEAEKQSTISTETLLEVTPTVAEDQELKEPPNGVLE